MRLPHWEYMFCTQYKVSGECLTKSIKIFCLGLSHGTETLWTHKQINSYITHICGLKFQSLLFRIHNRVLLNVCVRPCVSNDLKTKMDTHFITNWNWKEHFWFSNCASTDSLVYTFYFFPPYIILLPKKKSASLLSGKIQQSHLTYSFLLQAYYRYT